MILTVEILKRIGACDPSIPAFEARYPDGAEVDLVMADLKTENMDWYVWLAGNLIEATEIADVNAKDNCDWAPLHWAASNGHTVVAELLIAKGADVNAKNIYGETPLHCAVLNDETAVAELLITKGADVNAKTNDGETPLRWAVLNGETAVAKLLKKHGGIE